MARKSSWKFGVLVLSMLVLSPYLTFALRMEFDSKKDIANCELGPNATAKVSGGQLELKVAGGQNSGIYFGDPNWSDYKIEVKARKLAGPYFHLFTRVQKPAVDFYFMEISYNSHTNSVYLFQGGAGKEITGGPRPKRPDSKDTKGGDAYTIIFEVERSNHQNLHRWQTASRDRGQDLQGWPPRSWWQRLHSCVRLC